MKKLLILVTLAVSALCSQMANAADYRYFLPTFQEFHRGDTLSTPGYMLTLQATDGNLVLYRTSDNKPIWSTGTGSTAAYAVMQGDGNFVVYSTSGTALWSTESYGHPYAEYKFNLLSNGELQIDANGLPIIWRTAPDKTLPPSCPGGQKLSLYPICVRGNNQSVPACDVNDASQYARSIGGVYGLCR